MPKKIDVRTDEIIKLYNSGFSCQKIAEKFKTYSSTISRRLIVAGIKTRNKLKTASVTNRNRGIQHNYFETLNTEEKSYFVGLITADGCIYKPKVKGQMQLHLQLKNDDEYIIKKFSKELNLKRQKINNYKNLSKLCICSDKICIDLKKYGIEQRKTYTLKFSKNIPHEMFRHFLRGYFDGDGCIFTNQYSSDINFTCSSKLFLTKLKKYLKTNYNIVTKSKISDYNTYFVLHYMGIENCKKFYNLFYKNSKLFFKRKKNKFEKFLINKQS